MDDKFGVESNTNLNLIVFDEQEKVRIGAALQALADQMVPSVERQPFSYHNVDEYNDESQGSSYAKTNKQKNFGYSTTNNPKQKDETFLTFPSFDSTCISIRNEDEAEVDSNQVHLSSKELFTHNILTKEEPQLQEFKIEYPVIDDETFLAHSRNFSYSNDIEPINMQYISESGLSKNSCSNEKDNEEFVDSLESEPQGYQNDEPESDIEYKSLMHYCCPECGVDCGPYSNWIIHTEKQHKIAWPNLNSANGESFYQCLYCNKKLSHKMSLKLLQEHHIKHMPHKHYLKCGFCNKRFQALPNVYHHIKQKHAKLAHPYLKKNRFNPKMKYVKIFCPICQKPQTNLELWEQHLLEEHDYENKIKSQITQLGKNIYSCHLCQQKIHKTSNIKIHMLLHEPSKSFQCILCENFHTHLNNARQHISHKHLSNHQDKLLKCRYCDATFAKKSLLCNHKRRFHKNEMAKYTVIKKSTTNEDNTESGVSLGSTNHLFTNINLTKAKSQLQKFEVEPPAAGIETFSANSRNFSYSNEIEPINMQYISESGLSENSCSNEKDNEEFVDSLESEPQGNQNDEPEPNIEYKSLMRYCCPECGVDCGPYSNWIIHTEKQHEIAWPSLNTVNGEPFYQCLYCNKKLSHKMRVKLRQEHHIKHMPHKNYVKCGFCDKRFQVLSNLYPHLKEKHAKLAHPYLQKKYSNPKLKYIKIVCPICLQSQPNIKRWEQHLLEEHDYENKIKSQVTPLGKNMYSCHLCQKKISQTYRLKLHMLLHEPNKSFQCILCKKYDSHLDKAVLHINRDHHSHIHQNKPFKCSYCKRTFTRAVFLWRHNQNFHNKEQSKYTDIKNSFSSNEDVAEVDSNQVSLSTNELLTYNILTKEEPQLQEFQIEYPVIDEKTLSACSEDFSNSNEKESANTEYIFDVK